MAAGDEREALAALASRLCAEFGYATDRDGDGEAPQARAPSIELFGSSLGEEDERLIMTARESLTRIARALKIKMPAGVPEAAVPALLDGAEMVMRSELAMGNPPSTVLPSFVFLVALPLVDQDEALELSRRTVSLLEKPVTS